MEALHCPELDTARAGCSGFPLPPWRRPHASPASTGNGAANGTANPAAPPPLPGDERWRYYALHPWNLHNLPRAPGSLLRYLPLAGEGLLPRLTCPALSVGGVMSAGGWRAEELGLYSASYLHTGASKVRRTR